MEVKLEEIKAKCLSDMGVGQYIHISDEFTFNLPKPKTIHKKLYGSFNDSSIRIPSNFVFSVDDAWSAGEIGMMVCDKYLVTDTAIRKEFLSSPRTIKIDKSVISISHLWANNNYFHWLMSVMSRIGLLYETDTFKNGEVFIVNSNHHAYEQEGYSLLGIKKTIPCFNMWWKCRNLTIPSPVIDDATISPRGCKFLKETLTKLTGEYKGDKFPKRIYIGRKNGRSVTNQEEVCQYLSVFGFQKIFCEDYSFSDQVRMFSNAEYIVSPHGAGLANIIFCKSETKVLEILSPIYINSCFRRIAAYSNLDYRFMLGDGDISLIEHRDSDITVNLDILKESLNI